MSSVTDTPMDALPVVALTVGDMAGVGPELVLRIVPTFVPYARVLVVASAPWLDAARTDLIRRGVLPASAPALRTVRTPSEIAPATADGEVAVLCVHERAARVSALGVPERGGAYPWGQVVAGFGAVQHEALVAACALANAREVQAIVTAPWHKKRLADDGLAATGHTEVLAREAGAVDVSMVLAGGPLRVALVTTHLPLAQVPAALTAEAIRGTVQRLAVALRTQWGIDAPRIAVCGLNPHAGEEGVLGREEIDVIEPTLASLRREGLDVTGPWPADTIFPRVHGGVERADGIVAMYHDQGLGPLKTAAFGHAVNVTIGLPWVRTSVDHGTAYDRAGRGTASVGSLEEAVRLALAFVARQRV